MLGLRGRLLALVAVTLIPALAVEVMFLVGLHTARQDEIEHDVLRQAELVNDTITTIIEGARQLTYTLAQVETVANLQPACEDTLHAVKEGLANYRFISVVDATGRLVCTSFPSGTGVDIGRRPYLTDTLAIGSFTVGTFTRGAASGRPFLPLAQPVYGRDGSAIGVVVAGLDLEWLGDRLARLDRPPDSTIVVADRQGVVLARYPDSSQWSGRPFLPENMWLVEAQQRGAHRVAGYDGRDRIAGYIPPAASPTGLFVSVAYYVPTVMAPIWRFGAWGGAAILIGLAASAGLAWIVAQRLIRRPLHELATGAAELASGDLGARVQVSGSNTELTQLAHLFNTMAASLERRAVERDQAEHALRSARNELAAANARLEERVAAEVAVREQTQVQLRQSEKVNALGQLAGGVAHDFNNLLTAVLGSLQILRKRLPDEASVRRLLDNAVQGAERGAALTQRLLAFGRRQMLAPQPVDIAALVHGMTDLLRTSLGPGIEIATCFPDGLPPAYADINQLELALLNLVTNARDAMDGQGRLAIAARAEPPGDDHAADERQYVVITVSDSGHGMDEATLARAMDPFFTTKGPGKGTGLGLPMVHGLAAQSDGRLVLHSAPGRGTVAELWLPRAAAAAPSAPPASSATLPRPQPVRSLCVLVVDDDPLVLASAVAMLEDVGHRVVPATSGNQALERLRAGAVYDLVVTDISMPEMSGLQLATELRRLYPALPIILATGYADRMDVTDCGLPVLSKPFSQSALASAIDRVASDFVTMHRQDGAVQS
ncbi:MAG: response regulator [Proteobacteria bacterium]|nr:response regulator [Pseudomonadota bacterium]